MPRIRVPLAAIMLTLAGCASPSDDAGNRAEGTGSEANRVASSGKVDVPLAEVPAEVLAAAVAARPGFAPAEAERETRDGRLYYDVGGTLTDGSEIEFDIMQEGNGWRVVETQRDLAFATVPAPVREAAARADAALAPTRVIESVQADGLVIYELYAAAGGDPQGRKLEISWDGRAAEVLAREWAH